MTATIDGIAVLHDIVPRLRERNYALIADRLAQALDSAPRGTMRAWMEANQNRYVTTLQVDRLDGSVWAPAGRWITPRGTYALLAGSRRDYAGMRVIATTDTTLIVQDGRHSIAYIIEG